MPHSRSPFIPWFGHRWPACFHCLKYPRLLPLQFGTRTSQKEGSRVPPSCRTRLNQAATTCGWFLIGWLPDWVMILSASSRLLVPADKPQLLFYSRPDSSAFSSDRSSCSHWVFTPDLSLCCFFLLCFLWFPVSNQCKLCQSKQPHSKTQVPATPFLNSAPHCLDHAFLRFRSSGQQTQTLFALGSELNWNISNVFTFRETDNREATEEV